MNTKTPLEFLHGEELLLAARKRGVSAHGVELLQQKKGLEAARMFGRTDQQYHLDRLRELAEILICPVHSTTMDRPSA